MNHLIMFNTRFYRKPLLLCSLFLLAFFCRAVAQELEGGSRFVHGFARVQQGSDYYYIDSTGKRAFDRILDRDGHAFDVVPVAGNDGIIPGADTAEGHLPEYFKLVSLDKKQGVLLLSGKWMLRPEYDSIATEYREAWRVTKGGKSTLYKATGFALPFLFDAVNELDGNCFLVQQDDKWGIYDKRAAKLTTPCVYEDMDYCFGCESKGDYAFAQKNGKWGVISFRNDILLPFEYDHQHANMRSDEWVQCLSRDNKPLLINLRTKAVTEDTCGCLDREDDSAPLLADGFRTVRQGKLYGMVNADGQKVLPTQYESIRYDGIALPRPLVEISQQGKSGIADTSGHMIIQPLYDDYFMMISDTLLVAVRENKCYLFNTKGQPVLQGAYDDIRPWRPMDSDTTTAFLKLVRGELMGFYNLHTRKLVAPQYSYIYDTDTSRKYYLMAEKNGRQGVIDTNGTVIIPPRFDDVQFLANGYPNQAQVAINYKYGIYDYVKNVLVIPARYNNITPVAHHELYFVQRDNDKAEGLLDLEGKVAYPVLSRQRLDQADTLANYFVISRRDSLSEKLRYTVFNSRTHERYALPYDTVVPGGYKDRVGVHVGKRQYALFDLATRKTVEGAYTQDGLPQLVYPYQDKAMIMKNDKIGIIDTAGNFKIPPVYDMLYPVMENTYLFVQRDANGAAHYGYGDSTTKLFVPMEYDFLPGDREDYLRDSLLLLVKRGPDGTVLKGFAGLDGKTVIPAKYESIRATENKQYFLVKAGEQSGIIRRNGEVVLPVEFEEVLLDDNTLYFGEAAFSFPVMAKKNGTWAYYDTEGKALPLRMKATIDYMPVEEPVVVPVEAGH
ncbi:hypothetical protein DCC81_19040 [Chitinophaga parva]|uniref:WG repeat-containing protein n=2 Tax=Chitinophaga parva TaxID=2169414 RepID=A0A2T7BJ67_9BACT|nr:hypothetical protein DCC81_19040 [Chitinophaga parva]